MKIHKQGGQILHTGKANISAEFVYGYDSRIIITENLSASDKRRKLLTVELSQDEIMQCVDKLGLKLMPQWLVTVCEVVESGWVKLKGLVG